MPLIPVNGTRLYYELLGKGSPLVLIAGLACDHGMWAEVLDVLTQHYSVLIFDNRASGQSEFSGKPFSIQDMAEDLSCLMEKLSISSAYLLGHSMGGAIAMSLALSHPEKVKKMAVLCSSACFSERVKKMFQTQVRLLELATPIDVCMDSVFPWLFSNEYLSQSENVEKEKQRFLRNPHPQSKEAYAMQVQALLNYDLGFRVSKIQTPTLLLAAEEDLIAPPESMKKLHSEIPNSEFKLITQAGHCVIYEKPEIFVKEIMRMK